MNKKITALALCALATLGMSSCSSTSPQERAEETASGYASAYFGNGDRPTSDFACDGAELGSRYDPISGEVTIRDVERQEDGTWKIHVSISAGDGTTPSVYPLVREDGSCVLSV